MVGNFKYHFRNNLGGQFRLYVPIFFKAGKSQALKKDFHFHPGRNLFPKKNKMLKNGA
jgi:hypothetical protein